MSTPKTPEERATEEANAIAQPVLRSMYPSQSRSQMAHTFMDLYLAGWYARDEEVANWKWEYENACKFASSYESERDQLRAEVAACLSRLDDEIKVNNAGAERERQWMRRSGEYQLERDKLRAEAAQLKLEITKLCHSDSCRAACTLPQAPDGEGSGK